MILSKAIEGYLVDAQACRLSDSTIHDYAGQDHHRRRRLRVPDLAQQGAGLPV
jgi:hypothetical protein